MQSAPPLSADEKRWRMVTATMRKNGYTPDALIETLHTAQSAFGYLDDTALRFVATQLHVPLSKVYGVATFYHTFTLKLEGLHRCILCLGTACYIKGSHEDIPYRSRRNDRSFAHTIHICVAAGCLS